ncbi:MAG: porin [Deltaproteobacteria bacterium]|nr:porin [Deltaproteobacteria bacterium]
MSSAWRESVGLCVCAAFCIRGADSAAQSRGDTSLDLAPSASSGNPATSPGGHSDADPANEHGVEWSARVGHGLTVRSRDDRFALTLRARMQVRFTGEIPVTPAMGADPFRGEFNLRRARILMQGHALTPRFQYYIQLGVSPQDMEADLLIPLRDASLNYAFHDAIALRVGQMKVPFNRQRVISSSAQQFVDRSLANVELNLDRDIGLQFHSIKLLGGRLGYQVGVFGGSGRNRPALDSRFLYVARVQVQPFGRFEDMDHECDFARGAPRLSVAVGAAFNHQSPRSGSTIGSTYRLGRYDYLHGEVDMLFKWRGFTMQAEGLIRVADRPGTLGMAATGMSTIEYARSAWGYMVQAAYMLPSQVEFGARWGQVTPIALASAVPMVQTQDPSFVRSHELGGVVSYYAAQHGLKVQTDLFYLFGEALDAGRFQLRVQAQLYF